MTLRRFTHRTKKDEDRAEEIEWYVAHEQDAMPQTATSLRHGAGGGS